MRFPLNVYLLAFTSAAVVSALTLPLWRRWCLRIGLMDEPGQRKIHASPIPLAGGLAVLSGLCLPVIAGAVIITFQFGHDGSSVWTRAWLEAHKPSKTSVDHDENAPVTLERVNRHSAELMAYGLGQRRFEIAAIILGALGMVTLGLLDDKFELRAATKFSGQLALAILVAAAGVRITLFVPNVLFSYAVTVLWILTVTNALNFMDNMNGLCAGIGAIGALNFAWAAAAAGQYLVATMALLICGALCGFLPYNFPRATAFLGDSGSHLVGYLIAILAILPHFFTRHHPRPFAVLSPLLILAVPLFDLIWVVQLRWRMGKPFYVGDTNHLSHRLVRLGLSRTAAVLLIWLMAAATGILAQL